MKRKCTQCGGRQKVVSSRQVGSHQARYTKCEDCGRRSKHLVPRSEVWERVSALVRSNTQSNAEQA